MSEPELPPIECDDEGGAPVEEGAPLWTVTFGDMMSLLLTFFILLFSMSELKMEQFLLATDGLREALGGTAVETVDEPLGPLSEELDPELQLSSALPPSGAMTEPGTYSADSASALLAEAERLADQFLDSIASQLQDFVEEYDLEETLEVVKGKEGVHLRIEAVVLFASGEAAIHGENRWLVEVLAKITRQVSTPVVVVGHADNQPIRTASFASNWELSAARAAGVARGLVEGGHDPQRLRVESYGEYRPVGDNDTAKGRSRNRRVELFYARKDVVEQALAELKGEGRDPEPTAPEPATGAPAEASVPPPPGR